MTHRVARVCGAAVILLLTAAAARAQQSPSTPPAAAPLLDVPFIPQTEALCGGAAAAMVMRYWGSTGVNAETFSALVDASAGGIRGADLLADLRGRGWDARSFAGDARLIAARLRDRQPVVALIEDRPGALHYVVIVAWTNGRVVLHDPARAPFRVIDESSFERAWEKTNRWTMLLLPGTALSNTGRTVSAPGPSSTSPCDPLIAEAVRTAECDPAGAIPLLRTASTLCPSDSAAPRELAGVFALQENWKDAARYAGDAVRRNPADEHAWRILATSSFVQGDTARALAAWNRVAEPILDIVNVRGLEHTRYKAAIDVMRLRDGEVLEVGSLAAAARRLSELPAAHLTRVNYRPLENGRAAVDAVVIERSRFPFSRASLAAIGLRALSDHEAFAAVANPAGAGDLAAISWRWWEHRPRIGASYAAPAPFGGTLRADLFRETQTYAAAADGHLTEEVRRGGSLTLSDWTARDFRWEMAVGIASWSGFGKTLTTNASIEKRFSLDRVSVQGAVSALSGDRRAAASGLSAAWRSAPRNEGTVFVTRGGGEWTSAGAPLAWWPGAGTGHARAALLRAHPLLDDGVITGDVFGRQLYYASTEARRWIRPVFRFVRLAPAVFIDSARAEHRRRAGSAWQADAGAGIRVAVPGSGVLRVDVARGLRDGATAFSIGWTR